MSLRSKPLHPAARSSTARRIFSATHRSSRPLHPARSTVAGSLPCRVRDRKTSGIIPRHCRRAPQMSAAAPILPAPSPRAWTRMAAALPEIPRSRRSAGPARRSPAAIHPRPAIGMRRQDVVSTLPGRSIRRARRKTTRGGSPARFAVRRSMSPAAVPGTSSIPTRRSDW